MRRCADQVDCGYDNQNGELFCRACALPLLHTALAERYLVHELMSKGGYAAVFRATDQHLSRPIAIKVLLPSKTTPSEREHFLREARIAATLDHPNIASILDYGKDGPSVFLVMPLYTVGSLRTRLAQAQGPLPAPETIHNLHQLVSALSYAHTRPRPVIHRDIKPENILIHQDDSRLVITDFGIARLLEPGTNVGKTITVRGTIGYMAPEQNKGIVDPRSDQYSCAIVLYEMLTGYHPLDPNGKVIASPSMLNSDLSSSIDDILLRALATHPEDRYTDILQFMQAFDLAYSRGSIHNAGRETENKQVFARPKNGHTREAYADRISSQRTIDTRPAAHAVPSILRSELLSNGADEPEGDLAGFQRSPARSFLSEGRMRRYSDSLSIVKPLEEDPYSPRRAQEQCQEGDQLLRQQNYAQALWAYEKALEMDPDNFHGWNGRGTAFYNQGNYKKALAAYQHATEINSQNAIVWASAGLALNRLRRHQQALVHYERALAIEPEYLAAWNGKADVQLDMNMPREAYASYEQALLYDQKSFHAWNGLGNACSCLQNFTGAVDAYTHALLINPHSAVAWCNKAEALMHLGHHRAALDALDEATEVDRSYARAWTLKAGIYESAGNAQEAHKARRRAKPWGLVN